MFNELDLGERLLIARRGTAYFSHSLAALGAGDLDHPTLLPGWSGRHLLAHVAYNAAALRRLMTWASTGTETPMYASAEQRNQEIMAGAALSGDVLRNLYGRNVARLDDHWRNAPPAAWQASVRTAQGRTVPASETVWMRTREVWIHAVDLDAGARFSDFPAVVLDSLLSDIVGMWQRNQRGAGVRLAVAGRPPVLVAAGSTETTVSGSVAAVTRWAAGRGAIDVDIDGPQSQPPQWL